MSHDHSHHDISTQERINAARAACEAAGERFTALRAHVFELIIEDGGAVKAYDLLDRLRPEVGSPKPPTVYRALDFLSRLGFVHRVEALNAFIACDHGHSALAYMSCRLSSSRYASYETTSLNGESNVRFGSSPGTNVGTSMGVWYLGTV